MDVQRKVYPSVEQKYYLQELVQADYELRYPKFTPNFTKKESERRWKAIGDKLNSMPGCTKSWSAWRKTWQDKKSRKKRKLTNPKPVTELPAVPPQTQTKINVPETPVPAPGPSNSQESGENIEDILEAGSTVKVEPVNLDTSDSDDPLNFEEGYSISDPTSPEPEPEPEIEQPRNMSRDTTRRRFRRVLRRPVTQSRLDVINHITVNEVKKALIQKNEIKKQFYAEYMVEIRKQTQALISIAKRLSSNR